MWSYSLGQRLLPFAGHSISEGWQHRSRDLEIVISIQVRGKRVSAESGQTMARIQVLVKVY